MADHPPDILVVTFNAGSSSLRCRVFRLTGDDPQPLRAFHIRGLPDGKDLTERDPVARTQLETDLGRPQSSTSAHPEALTHLLARLDSLSDPGRIAAFSHRIGHGGRDHAAPVVITEQVLATRKALEPLAPSHQPHNLAPIRRVQNHYPDIPQIGCFDTAFHRSQPRVAQLFGLPRALTHDGLLRYGFHGLSYDYIAHELRLSYPDLAKKRVIVAQLGRSFGSLAAAMGGRRRRGPDGRHG